MPFDPRTKALMDEFFKDKKCCKCAQPAVRLRRNEFFCADCVPSGGDTAVKVQKVKDPKLGGR